MSVPTIEDYIAGFGDWRRETLRHLRELVEEAAPRATSGIKWAQPVWESRGPMVWMKAYATHVNIGFWRGTELHDEFRVLAGGGQRMRHLTLRRGDLVPDEPIRDLVRQAVALNEAKGDPTRRR